MFIKTIKKKKKVIHYYVLYFNITRIIDCNISYSNKDVYV